MKQIIFHLLCCTTMIILSCGEGGKEQNKSIAGKVDSTRTYADDRDFLKKYTAIVELQKGLSKLLIAPRYQGRVMTSSCDDDSGYSFGWINYDLVASNKLKEHINPYGGEERLWLAPEGGQFSFFFKKDVPYDFDHWFTPKEFDTE